MNEIRARCLVASGAAALVAAGCRPPNSGASAAAPSTATVGQPMPGYAASPPPPGYPGTYYAAPPPGPQAPSAAYASPPPASGAAPAYPRTAAAPPGYPPAPAPPPAASTAPPAGAFTPTDPNSLQSILAGIQGALQATLISPGSLPVDLAEAGLRAQALRLAAGMQPEGPELEQTLQEGQHAVTMVTLQAGKCYTILGFSPPGAVKELDLNMLAPPFYVTLAGQSLTRDAAPSIAPSPNPMCPVIAIALEYKLDVFARSGHGPVAVQLYSKVKR